MAPCSRGDGLCSPREGMMNLGSRVHPTPPPRPAPSPPTSHRPNKEEPCSRIAGAGAGGQLGAVVLPASGRGGRGLCWGTLAAPGFPPCPLSLSSGGQGGKRPCSAWARGWAGIQWAGSAQCLRVRGLETEPSLCREGHLLAGRDQGRGGGHLSTALVRAGEGRPQPAAARTLRSGPELWFGLRGQGCPGAATGTGRAGLDSKRPSKKRRTEAAHTAE